MCWKIPHRSILPTAQFFGAFCDIALTAFVRGHVTLQDLPDSVKQNPSFFKSVTEKWNRLSERMRSLAPEDQAFFQFHIECKRRSLLDLPADVQRRFPEFVWTNVGEFLERYGLKRQPGILFPDVRRELLGKITEEVRNTEMFVEAWFSSSQRAGSYWPTLTSFPTQVSDDDSFFLGLASRSPVPDRASNRLKSDRVFMLKAIEHYPHFYTYMSEDIKTLDNVELLLMALAGSQGFALDDMGFRPNQRANSLGRQHLTWIRVLLQIRLRTYESFLWSILKEIARDDCDLSILNQGHETSIALKKRIMEYAGVPWT